MGYYIPQVVVHLRCEGHIVLPGYLQACGQGVRIFHGHCSTASRCWQKWVCGITNLDNAAAG